MQGLLLLLPCCLHQSGLVTVVWRQHAQTCWHALPGLENSSPPREGQDLAGHPPPGACRLPQKLAGRRAESQSRQPSFGGRPAVQTTFELRPARHSPGHRLAFSARPIMSGLTSIWLFLSMPLFEYDS